MEEYSETATFAQFYRRRKKIVKKDEEPIQEIETNVIGLVEHDVEKEVLLLGPPVEEPCSGDHVAQEIEVSLFDSSIESYFKTMEKISQLCGEKELDDSNRIELERLSSSIMFLSEWKQFTYHTKTIQFACQSENIPQGKDIVGSIELPQFSASAVPKGKQKESSISSDSSKDFLMCVGGLVWALDWCPRFPQDSGHKVTCEFISVAAHPPDASYHKIGAPLSGRGLIQIWCTVHETFDKIESLPKKKKAYQSGRPRGRPRKVTNTDQSPQPKKPIGRPRKIVSMDNPPKPKKPKGRPRKFPLKEPNNNSTCSNDSVSALSVQLPDGPLSLLPDDGVSGDIECVPECSRTEQECLNPTISSGTVRAASTRKRKKLYAIVECDNGSDDDPPLMQNEIQQPKLIDVMPHTNVQEHVCSGESITNGGPLQNQSNSGITKDNKHTQKRPRGRPRKFPLKEPSNNSTCSNDSVPALSVQLPDGPLSLLPDDGVSGDIECVPECSRTEQECLNPTISSGTVRAASTRKRKKLYAIVECDNGSDDDPPLMQNEIQQPKVIDVMPHTNAQEHVCSGESITNGGPLQNQSNSGITKDLAVPRVVLCLAHNGKVAWDVKWRPAIEDNVKHRLGYLAVLLGNGALEVWDVPHPYAMKFIYSSCQKEGTDPRFLKLDPVFRCSIIKTGDRQSIPLTVEWSSSFPHDLIVAGCHDGVVALWKFSADKSSKDTRPLLCFSADTVPIRTLAWAPSESGSESSNVIVTAGHIGMKFWDLRDPFRPLWDFHPIQRNIYSLDWLSDPSCMVVAFDDGTLRILSFSKAAIDFPVTGKPYSGKPQQGFTSYCCSSFPIWNVQCSRSSGIVAYCGADGNVLQFQLTRRAVDKDPHRNRAPHFLCGSIKEEEGSILTVVTPMDETPFPMKKSSNKWSNYPCTMNAVTCETNRANREKASQTFKNNIVALYNPADRLEANDGPSSERRSKYKTWGGKGKKKGEEPLAIVACSSSSRNMGEEEEDGGDSNAEKGKDDDDGEDTNNSKGEEEVIEVFPSKSVAIHRVRWNKNKGSEKWLCYGGAAGIVRLQEI